MKTRMLVSILILIMAVLIIAVSCATDPMKYISKDYEIYGSWVVNTGKATWNQPYKLVFYQNGTFMEYMSKDSTYHQIHDFIITDKSRAGFRRSGLKSCNQNSTTSRFNLFLNSGDFGGAISNLSLKPPKNVRP